MIRLFLTATAMAAALGACSPPAPTPAAPEPPAAQPAQAAAIPDVLTLTCGPDSLIKGDVTKEKLIALYGAENVTEETVPWVDSEEKAVVLFPKDDARRAELLWLDKTSGGPRHIRVGGGQTTGWTGPSGIRVGSTIAEVEAVNGAPFSMTAFENHNHGEVNFGSGKLGAVSAEGCSFGMSMDMGPDSTQEPIDALTGDSEKSFSSDSREMLAAKPVVAQFWIGFSD